MRVRRRLRRVRRPRILDVGHFRVDMRVRGFHFVLDGVSTEVSLVRDELKDESKVWTDELCFLLDERVYNAPASSAEPHRVDPCNSQASCIPVIPASSELTLPSSKALAASLIQYAITTVPLLDTPH